MAIYPINYISLCTGGAGLELGFELALPNSRAVCLLEREAFAVGHLVAAMQQGLLAQAPVWSDVTTFDGRPWRGIVDGVIGGIPCQPWSLAGKRGGSDDERDLWSDARRIIVQSGAWFVLIENVSGMLSAKPGLDPGALRVRRDLQRLGFDVEGGLFTASEVGASHERERVFILAVADASGARLAVGQQPAIKRGNIRDERSPASARCDGMGGAIGCGHDWRPDGEVRRSIERTSLEGSSREPDGSMADSDIVEFRRQPPSGKQLQLQRDDALGLFPPGPSDLSRWRHTLERAPELEPAIRKLADELVRGVYGTLLDRTRVDQLRLLGNGVVPLQAALAIRTLSSRLAARGSKGAAFISTLIEDHLKMMDDSESQLALPQAAPPAQLGLFE